MRRLPPTSGLVVAYGFVFASSCLLTLSICLCLSFALPRLVFIFGFGLFCPPTRLPNHVTLTLTLTLTLNLTLTLTLGEMPLYSLYYSCRSPWSWVFASSSSQLYPSVTVVASVNALPSLSPPSSTSDSFKGKRRQRPRSGLGL
jgi:hypothetical protein